MTEKEIYAKLEKIIQGYLPEDVSAKNINPDSDITKELNINSSHLVDIVLDVEDAFDITLSNDDMESFRTVKDAVKIINQKL